MHGAHLCIRGSLCIGPSRRSAAATPCTPRRGTAYSRQPSGTAPRNSIRQMWLSTGRLQFLPAVSPPLAACRVVRPPASKPTAAGYSKRRQEEWRLEKSDERAATPPPHFSIISFLLFLSFFQNQSAEPHLACLVLLKLDDYYTTTTRFGWDLGSPLEYLFEVSPLYSPTRLLSDPEI